MQHETLFLSLRLRENILVVGEGVGAAAPFTIATCHPCLLLLLQIAAHCCRQIAAAAMGSNPCRLEQLIDRILGGQSNRRSAVWQRRLQRSPEVAVAQLN